MNKESGFPLAYVCFPWDVPEFYTSQEYSLAIATLYKLNFNPLVAEPHIIDYGDNSMRLLMAYDIIAVSDVIAVFHEEHCTEMMVKEMLYAKQLGKPFITVNRKQGT